MSEDDRLEEYLLICLATHDQLVQERRWPWADSTDQTGLVESEDNRKAL
jgi:phage gp46-like protein